MVIICLVKEYQWQVYNYDRYSMIIELFTTFTFILSTLILFRIENQHRKKHVEGNKFSNKMRTVLKFHLNFKPNPKNILFYRSF